MGNVENPLIKLQDLSKFLEQSSLDDNLRHLAEMTAKILAAENCSIMLLNDGEGKNLRMSICASYGPLPAAAYKESIAKGEGIAGRVVATGLSLLIEDITNSEFAKWARRANDPRNSLISSPVTINTRIVGVVNISGREQGGAFNLADLNLLDVVALFIGKSIQVVQLQTILNSRFAQMALVQEANTNLADTLSSITQSTDQVAKIMAKSFYKEMERAGFSSGQIINAASEIIDQLSGNLQRNSKRAAQESANAKDSPSP